MIHLGRRNYLIVSVLTAVSLFFWTGAAYPTAESSSAGSTRMVLPQPTPDSKAGPAKKVPASKKTGEKKTLPRYGEITQESLNLEVTALVLASTAGRLVVWAEDRPGVIYSEFAPEPGCTVTALGTGKVQKDSFELQALTVGVISHGTPDSQRMVRRYLASVPTQVRASAEILLISDWIAQFNSSLSRTEQMDIATWIVEAAEEHSIDPLLLASLIAQESGFEPQAVSPVGAMGLGQLMPETAELLGVADPWDPRENLRGAARYLSWQLERWEDSADPVSLALASYNAGPGAVEQYGGIPPYAETQNYVASISSLYGELRYVADGLAETTKERSPTS
ncbi:MAG: lytic transglycosylase domain-containing protein [Armatimonadetes bacterium]|nr:lytic transglycosylase domain-containing protein [Armatimonadota bacterium]